MQQFLLFQNNWPLPTKLWFFSSRSILQAFDCTIGSVSVKVEALYFCISCSVVSSLLEWKCVIAYPVNIYRALNTNLQRKSIASSDVPHNRNGISRDSRCLFELSLIGQWKNSRVWGWFFLVYFILTNNTIIPAPNNLNDGSWQVVLWRFGQIRCTVFSDMTYFTYG